MKKILSVAAVAALFLASCSSVSSKISDLEKACKDGDVEKIKSVSEDLANTKDWTEDDIKAYEKAIQACGDKAAENIKMVDYSKVMKEEAEDEDDDD